MTRSPRSAAPFAVALLLAVGPAAASAATLVPKAPEGDRACLVCHTTPIFDPAGLPASVHKELNCVDCHDGYDFKTHEAKAEEPSEEDAKLAAKLAGQTTAPKALLACRDCHDTVVGDVLHGAHGRWLREDRPVAGPTCLSCHGEPHHIGKTGEPGSNATVSARCESCHEDEKVIQAAGLSAAPRTYRDSLHGRLVALGNPRAPGCADCHGAHDVAGPEVATSPVSPQNKVKTCQKCHEGANENFAAAFTHEPLNPETQPGPFWIHTFFSWLTALTLTALFLHVLLDLAGELRHKLSRRGHGEPAVPAGLPRSVVRFDLHQRIQHWMLIVSVIALVLTGWPIRAASVGSSGVLVGLFGGPAGAALAHRITGALLGIAAVYHLVYLTWRILAKRAALAMLPAPKDLVDVWNNLAYLLRLRPDRPKFGKFSYIEKFDYWAVFWGVAIMGGTGLVRWFPVWFAKFLPGWMLLGAQLAHGEEATLAALALFVWHFYNVHLRPSIFPMNWVWLTGRISIENLREEHGQQYDQLLEGRGAKDEERP
jgi:cytochrome b subunit of formate dehydrogenase